MQVFLDQQQGCAIINLFARPGQVILSRFLANELIYPFFAMDLSVDVHITSRRKLLRDRCRDDRRPKRFVHVGYSIASIALRPSALRRRRVWRQSRRRRSSQNTMLLDKWAKWELTILGDARRDAPLKGDACSIPRNRSVMAQVFWKAIILRAQRPDDARHALGVRGGIDRLRDNSAPGRCLRRRSRGSRPASPTS